MHSLMLGFSPVLLQVFSTMLGFTLNMISCISFYNIFLCLFHRRSDLEHAAGMSCSQARGLDNKNYSTWLLWLACLCRLGGWMPQNYSMLTHVKTRGKKNSTLCAMTFGSFIPNLGIWIQGSGAARHVSSMLIFQIFGR